MCNNCRLCNSTVLCGFCLHKTSHFIRLSDDVRQVILHVYGKCELVFVWSVLKLTVSDQNLNPSSFQGLWSHLLFTFGFRVAYIGFWPIYASISPQVASIWHFLMFSSLQNSGMGDVLLAFDRTCVVVFETYYSLFSSERVLGYINFKMRTSLW